MAERDPKTGRFPRGSGRPANGEGWGGPAKGASTSRVDSGALGDAIRALARDPQNMAMKQVAREAIFQTWAEVMVESESDGYRIAAADKLLERIDGKAPSTMLMGGADGAQPIVIERRIVDTAGD